jgi:hypothetical protein
VPSDRGEEDSGSVRAPKETHAVADDEQRRSHVRGDPHPEGGQPQGCQDEEHRLGGQGKDDVELVLWLLSTPLKEKFRSDHDWTDGVVCAGGMPLEAIIGFRLTLPGEGR